MSTTPAEAGVVLQGSSFQNDDPPQHTTPTQAVPHLPKQYHTCLGRVGGLYRGQPLLLVDIHSTVSGKLLEMASFVDQVLKQNGILESWGKKGWPYLGLAKVIYDLLNKDKGSIVVGFVKGAHSQQEGYPLVIPRTILYIEPFPRSQRLMGGTESVNVEDMEDGNLPLVFDQKKNPLLCLWDSTKWLRKERIGPRSARPFSLLDLEDAPPSFREVLEDDSGAEIAPARPSKMKQCPFLLELDTVIHSCDWSESGVKVGSLHVLPPKWSDLIARTPNNPKAQNNSGFWGFMQMMKMVLDEGHPRRLDSFCKDYTCIQEHANQVAILMKKPSESGILTLQPKIALQWSQRIVETQTKMQVKLLLQLASTKSGATAPPSEQGKSTHGKTSQGGSDHSKGVRKCPTYKNAEPREDETLSDTLTIYECTKFELTDRAAGTSTLCLVYKDSWVLGDTVKPDVYHPMHGKFSIPKLWLGIELKKANQFSGAPEARENNLGWLDGQDIYYNPNDDLEYSVWVALIDRLETTVANDQGNVPVTEKNQLHGLDSPAIDGTPGPKTQIARARKEMGSKEGEEVMFNSLQSSKELHTFYGLIARWLSFLEDIVVADQFGTLYAISEE
ncbi:hypothetical protein BS47DRAFT_1367664 [Hydnum rufescens UP504]|uniref:Uncharacterized protein n=1 Tax=Hydnum rufescens UP504 TaxID=1448309 RepID=A0A9P6AHR8_9AGAM|nr:hypothetical protein BS47DRAFT_1367664 [Hydnum rufescens UP504]